MASLPGGEMETLMTSNQGGLRKKAQTGSKKNLNQVLQFLKGSVFINRIYFLPHI